MKSLQNQTRRTSLAWVRRLLAAALVAAFTSASSGIYISNLRITGVSPINEIQCGTSAWVTVKF